MVEGNRYPSLFIIDKKSLKPEFKECNNIFQIGNYPSPYLSNRIILESLKGLAKTGHPKDVLETLSCSTSEQLHLGHCTSN